MSCTAPTIVVGGVTISTSDFVNSLELTTTVSGDGGDPTADAYDESIAGGNNTKSTSGIQFNGAKQTTPPPPISEPAIESKVAPPTEKPTIPVTCSTWDGDYDFQLSPNFKVSNFSTNAVFKNDVTSLSNITASARVCNLQALAVNVAEAMYAKFGAFNINSGIRNTNTTSSGLSQHVLGQAMDVQFSGWTYARYWENAAWVKDNIAYDQFIFEHSSLTGLAWYHLSFNPDGNRSPTSSSKVMTMYRNQYSPGLHRYG